MNFTPIIVMNLILLVITVLIAVCDRLLVTYGECKITVSQEGEKKEFLVLGGDYLLSNLTENDINISSSCGGKATCGYCKVKVINGGGPLLPTEEIFMSREEKLDDIRLACQVKVKNDIEIYIPDYLTTVKNIVKNQLYDPKQKWKFNISGSAAIVRKRKKIKLAAVGEIEVRQIIEKYRDEEGSIVSVLQSINNKFNHLPEPLLRYTAEKFDISLVDVIRIATFYNAFSFEPKGKNVIKVCLGTSCYVKGGKRILQILEKRLGIKVGKSTKDLKFCLETVNCIGCCGQSPVMSINDNIYGYLRQDMVHDILNDFIKRS